MAHSVKRKRFGESSSFSPSHSYSKGKHQHACGSMRNLDLDAVSDTLVIFVVVNCSFDPLRLGTNTETLKWFREAELTNGRWAMAAVAGILFTDLVGLPKFWLAGGEVCGSQHGACMRPLHGSRSVHAFTLMHCNRLASSVSKDNH